MIAMICDECYRKHEERYLPDTVHGTHAFRKIRIVQKKFAEKLKYDLEVSRAAVRVIVASTKCLTAHIRRHLRSRHFKLIAISLL